MSERPAYRRFGEIAQKWRALAQRRREHFVELYASGRWKRYYSEAKFIDRMREVTSSAERWAAIAPPPAAGSASAGLASQTEPPSRRTAA